ncbi:signal peptidase type I [Trypanosoma grayi]|uniref:signal peptidase type I n=1 Tax=Trypanosoma grayi TaxID=71804 RepID=UPI0004F49218|nr:signal peptidase type I [Trypanosoma grayi]KEG12683.1 signal peptidase type I [Trypanosoma grayi]
MTESDTGPLLQPYDPLAAQVLREHKKVIEMMEKRSLLEKVRNYVRSLVSGSPEARGVLTFVLALSVFMLLWRTAGFLTSCDNPLVVVLSGSMEPAYHRGDLLLLHKVTPVNIGDVIVFTLPDRTVPIVHRVHRVHEGGGTRLFLTKGDNNEFDDRTLYPTGHRWVREEDAVGKVFAIIPSAGFLTIFSEGRPWVKVVVLAAALAWGWFSGE